MIVLSVGMPRAGSGWYYNLTHDLMVASGGQDARQVRQRYHLGDILTEVNCNIGALTPPRLLAVLIPSLLGNTFVIKAHAAPTPMALWLVRRGWLRTAYIYRDPRDAMLSAFENGQRALEKGRPNAFSGLTGFDQTLEFMETYVKISHAWLDCELVLHTRYEDFLTAYEPEVEHLVSFLGLDLNSSPIRQVIAKYRPEEASQDQKGLHFRKGKIGRYRQKWTPEQQVLLWERFNSYLIRTNYKP